MTVYENFESVLSFLADNDASAEMVEFIQSRMDQEAKARANAKAKRLEKNGGEKKDPANSDFYTNLRNAISAVLTGDFQTGDDLVKASGVTTPSGKRVLAAQVATALKPLVADGTVETGEVIVTITNKQGLTQQTIRKGYKLA